MISTIIFYVVLWYIIGFLSSLFGYWVDHANGEPPVTNLEVVQGSLILGLLGLVTLGMVIIITIFQSPRAKEWLKKNAFEKSNSAQEEKEN